MASDILMSLFLIALRLFAIITMALANSTATNSLYSLFYGYWKIYIPVSTSKTG
jgi:hypothetical protein